MVCVVTSRRHISLILNTCFSRPLRGLITAAGRDGCDKEWAWIEGLAGKNLPRGQLGFIGINIPLFRLCAVNATTFSLIRDLPKIIIRGRRKGTEEQELTREVSPNS